MLRVSILSYANRPRINNFIKIDQFLNLTWTVILIDFVRITDRQLTCLNV